MLCSLSRDSPNHCPPTTHSSSNHWYYSGSHQTWQPALSLRHPTLAGPSLLLHQPCTHPHEHPLAPRMVTSYFKFLPPPHALSPSVPTSFLQGPCFLPRTQVVSTSFFSLVCLHISLLHSLLKLGTSSSKPFRLDTETTFHTSFLHLYSAHPAGSFLPCPTAYFHLNLKDRVPQI